MNPFNFGFKPVHERLTERGGDEVMAEVQRRDYTVARAGESVRRVATMNPLPEEKPAQQVYESAAHPAEQSLKSLMNDVQAPKFPVADQQQPAGAVSQPPAPSEAEALARVYGVFDELSGDRRDNWELAG